jgi:hypothetical protein
MDITQGIINFTFLNGGAEENFRLNKFRHVLVVYGRQPSQSIPPTFPINKG